MKKFRILIGVFITLALIYFSFRGINWDDFAKAILKVHFVVILMLFPLGILAALVRSWRWKLLLSNIGDVSLWSSFNFMNIGYLINSVLPARSGDLVRPILLAEKIKKKKMAVVATVVVERLFDYLALLFFLLYAVINLALPLQVKRNGGLVVIVSILILASLYVLGKNENISKKIIAILSFKNQKIRFFLQKLADDILLSIKVLTDIKKSLSLLLLSLSIVVIYILSVFLILASFDFGIREWDAAIMLIIFISFAMIIPSSPGNFGPYQAASILSLGLFKVTKTDALAASLLLQIPSLLLNIILGSFSLWWEGLNFGMLRKAGGTVNSSNEGN
jgi:uncharacterized protein (TIRG00374 family)